MLPKLGYSQNSRTSGEFKQDSIYKIKLPRGWGFVVPESRFNIALYKMISETKRDSVIKEQDAVIARKDSTIKIYEKRRIDDFNEMERIKEESKITEQKFKKEKNKVSGLQADVKKHKRRSWFGIGVAVVVVVLNILIK